MRSALQRRHSVNVIGSGKPWLVFAHGFGCDQGMWRFVLPLLSHQYTVLLYDLVGCGKSDLDAYDRDKYCSLHGHASDLIEIIDAFAGAPVVFVGHSVSATIGMLATIQRPVLFAGQVMIGPSPCYLNDGSYVGGFNYEDISALLQLLHDDFVKWSIKMAPVIMGAPGHPALQQELCTAFLKNDRRIAEHFGRVAFMSDHRKDVPLSPTRSLVVQCSDDLLVPREVGSYLHRHLLCSRLVVVDNIGHCPHMSTPAAVAGLIDEFVQELG
jgi:sigma-B regulation protein RsbQ